MFSIGAGILALLIAAMLSSSIMKAEAGNALMQEISGHIHEGAMAFLYREYKALAVFIVVVAIIIGIFVINIYEADTEVTKETTKVGVILNGSIDDRSWSQSHYEGLEATAQELNLSIIIKKM